MIYVTEKKLDTEESIADYVNEVGGSAKSNLSVSSDHEESSIRCNQLSWEMQLKNRREPGYVQL